MLLFLLFSAPILAFAFSVSRLSTGDRAKDFSAYVKGCLGFLPSVILIAIARGLFTPAVGSFDMAVAEFIDLLCYAISAFLCYAAFYPLDSGDKAHRYSHLLFIGLGMMTMANVEFMIWNVASRDPYVLFVMPMLRIALVFGLAWVVEKLLEDFSPIDLLWPLGYLAYLFACGLIVWLDTIGQGFLAVAILFLTIVAVALASLEALKRRLASRGAS